MQARIAQPLLAVLLVATFSHIGEAKDLKVFRKGKISLVDETQFKNPSEYNFDEDLQKMADFDNAYDEVVPNLPRFQLVKNGKVAGYTKIAIVTRPGSHWSTPRPVTKKGDQYKTWGTPYIIPVTKPPRRFETKVRSEPVKVESRTLARTVEPKTSTARTTAAPTTTTTVSTTTRTTTPTTPVTTHAPTTHAPSTHAPSTTAPTTHSTTTTQAPTTRAFVTRAFVTKKPSFSGRIGVFPTFENKFAQRFGVNRVVPQTATTPQPTIVINEIVAKSNPLVSVGFPHSAQQKVRSNQVILESSPKKTASSLQTLRPRPIAEAHPAATILHAIPVAHPTPSHTRFTTTEAPTTTTPQTTVATTTVATTTTRAFPTRNPALGPAAPKPPIIHHGDTPYRGPTFNCRILNPLQDGRPHPRTDPSCRLSMPGFSADGSCRCTYEVQGRDEDGCATGFLYICKPR